MSTPTRGESPDFYICDDDEGRARVVSGNTNNKFRVGDSVYLNVGGGKEGPFVIETVPTAGQYTLCTEDGKSVKRERPGAFHYFTGLAAESNMDGRRENVDYFAILVGINFYKEAPLKGCVRDVQEMAKYLKRVQPEAQVHALTADSPGDGGSSLPTEDPSCWPTFENISLKMQEVVSIARPGDHVHIHYSGHGTRTEPSGDLALDLLGDMQGTGVRYLRGLELARLLQDLIVKKLEVTLVLDCCFSGSVSRDDSSVRYLSYNSRTDAEYDAAAPTLDSEEQMAPPSHRNASMRDNWLMNPDGYTIVTACGPCERAREIRLSNDERHGALSYFFLRTLTGLGGLGRRQGYIYNHLCARFKEYWPHQNPMLYGTRDKCFFSNNFSEAQIISIQAISRKDGTLQLQAGQAQGICKGDRFAISPYYSVENTFAASQDPFVATVACAGALQSTLEILKSTTTGAQTWWNAVALTRNYLNKYPVQVPIDTPFREEWVAALRERSLCAVKGDESHFAFAVRSKVDHYDICDNSTNEIVHVPAMAQVRTTPDQVCDVIQHLAKFTMVGDLANDTPRISFQKSFTISLASPSGGIFHSGSSVQVDHHDVVTLTAENMGDRELYVYIFDMGPNWQVKNIFQGNHDVVLPSRKDQASRGTSTDLVQPVRATET
ncbi:caspase domain-containing protein [Colletotrichum melonis]|uniref:Caspase domain-containing protein n=1 Tax=Colletotrichum melonis TaxID=1209925 RepID=A0AAI9UD37_9PEZI|nr:caspase domain-containing protein [Colletotrichum melonis]